VMSGTSANAPTIGASNLWWPAVPKRKKLNLKEKEKLVSNVCTSEIAHRNSVRARIME
jgi:hypothetical protein